MQIDNEVLKVLNEGIEEISYAPLDAADKAIIKDELDAVYKGYGWITMDQFIEDLQGSDFRAHNTVSDIIDKEIEATGIAKIVKVKDIKNPKDLQDFNLAEFNPEDEIIVTKMPANSKFYGESKNSNNPVDQEHVDYLLDQLSKIHDLDYTGAPTMFGPVKDYMIKNNIKVKDFIPYIPKELRKDLNIVFRKQYHYPSDAFMLDIFAGFFDYDSDAKKLLESKNEAYEFEWEEYQSGVKGDFMKALAKAFDLADSKNVAKLASAFPEIYRIYAEFHGDVLNILPKEVTADDEKVFQ